MSKDDTPFDRELRQPLAFPTGTSVPHTLAATQSYCQRLEGRWKTDQQRNLEAVRHLDIAILGLNHALLSRRPCSRLDIAIALGETQIARESLLLS